MPARRARSSPRPTRTPCSAIGAGVVHGMPRRERAQPFWEYEFEVPDFNKFTDLARGPRQVADLHAATGGRPQRSARWRELRTLMRRRRRAARDVQRRRPQLGPAARSTAPGSARGFSDDEVAFVETIAPVVGRALRLVAHLPARRRRRPPAAPGWRSSTPTTASCRPRPRRCAGSTSSSRSAACHDPLLGRRRPERGRRRRAGGARPRARRRDGRAAATRTRARTRSGVWLLVHASCLRGADGTTGDAAVVDRAGQGERGRAADRRGLRADRRARSTSPARSRAA